MITRTLATRLLALSQKFQVVTVTGPRQSGKTTLVRATFPALPYVSLEDPEQQETATRTVGKGRKHLVETLGGAALRRLHLHVVKLAVQVLDFFDQFAQFCGCQHGRSAPDAKWVLWPLRMDFSRAEAMLIASRGRATSMSFLVVWVMGYNSM